MQDAKEEVRSRLNIEDVIGEYVQLKRAGRNFRGLSPFSNEKTPSFYVSPEKNIWHDFSSNKGGDVFSFIMEVEGMDFRASLEHLARKAGVDMSMYDNKGDQEISRKKKRFIEAHELAANYYQQSLVKNQHAVNYIFKKRGLSKQIVQDFKIGYAPTSGDALIQFLTKKGFSKQELSQAGLTNRFGGDLFRGRMTIPLMDSSGQVIGFTGRVLVEDPKSPKYLNTPQTLIYDKSRHVFGLSQAKEAIRANDYAVIVEGNMDVISSHQVGVTQVVATAGTAMTEYHLKAISRFSGNIRLAFDGDKAGLAATERAIPIAQNVGVELTIITLIGDAKDPDELIKKNPKLWQESIDLAEPAVEWVIRQYSQRNDLKTAAGKREFTTQALNVIRMLSDPVEQEFYVEKVSKISASSLEAIKEKLDSDQKDNETRPLRRVMANIEKVVDESYLEDNLLAVALIDSATHDLFRNVDRQIFTNEERIAVVDFLQKNGGQSIKETPVDLQKYDTYVKILLLKADARYADWSEKDRYFETARLIRLVSNEHKKKQKDILTQQLRDAEGAGDEAKASELRGMLNNLIKEIQNGQR